MPIGSLKNKHTPTHGDVSTSHMMDIADEVTECALDVPGSICSTDETVNEMKQHLQKKNIDIRLLKDAKSIVETVKSHLKCDTEECVLTNHDFVKGSNKDIINESLDRIKPLGPADSTKLLNNDNIDNVLKKLTKRHKGFYHMNFQMIDFAGEKNSNGEWVVKKGQKIQPTSLGEINMVSDVLNKGFKTFGVVMNTDVRTGGGIHWFSLFVCFRSDICTIEYFNSSGNKPVKQIQDWMIKTEENINSSGLYKASVIILSGFVHQIQSQTECGLYSLYYIWNRLNGIPSMNFQNKRIPDSQMIKWRRQVFKLN
jgi:hypothetical protein